MAKKKTNQKMYVVDTNVFISDPNCISKFDDNIIVVPDVVIEELDDHKDMQGDKGYNVREALRSLDRLRKDGDIVKGVKTEHGGLIRIESKYEETPMPKSWNGKPDNRILQIAKGLAENSSIPVIVVSKDMNVRIKANIIGLVAEDYKHEMIDEDHLRYNGRASVALSNKEFENFLSGAGVPVKKAKLNKDCASQTLFENEFLVIRNDATSGTKLGKIRDGMIVPLRYEHCTPFGVTPRNSGQRFCIEALMSPAAEIPLVILKGSAGTAKTFLTLACGLEQCMEQNIYRKLTITRANVEFDRDIGALPGDEESKVGPLLRGCMDNLELLVDAKGIRSGEREDRIKDKVMELLDRGYISTEALGFLRGRSLTRQILYVDEVQNTSPSQMKGILTRVGQGTKLVISGDLNQIDNPRLDKHNNGLAFALKLLSGDPLCCVVGFTEKETTRSELAAKVASMIC